MRTPLKSAAAVNKAAEAAMMASEQPSEWADNRESGPEEAHHCLFFCLFLMQCKAAAASCLFHSLIHMQTLFMVTKIEKETAFYKLPQYSRFSDRHRRHSSSRRIWCVLFLRTTVQKEGRSTETERTGTRRPTWRLSGGTHTQSTTV